MLVAFSYLLTCSQNSVITLVQKFGPQVMMIFNAILSEKRVLILGFGCSAGEVWRQKKEKKRKKKEGDTSDHLFVFIILIVHHFID